ncbi:hypothetical protein J5N97_012655 [Dioscorea zingiberensis]|uniref:Uncharacterized protein n=1 Tax=Dioscorea zingiberensis TaxID=325984 RepID=A0A9D5CPC2_9LILI|nr:hypothetical protein J5N97_012655 [Dioscorea zingiberensis]
MPFVNRTLARCKEFEETGRSCFSEPVFREILFSTPPQCNNQNPMASYAGTLTSQELVASGSMTSLIERNGLFPDQKGFNKGKNLNRDAETRNSIDKVGSPSSNKAEQNTTHPLNSMGGILQSAIKPTLVALPTMHDSSEPMTKVKRLKLSRGNSTRNATRNVSKDLEDKVTLYQIDSSQNLELVDGLHVVDRCIGSWLDIDEDAFEGEDLVGLDIPTDDLRELDSFLYEFQP